MEAKALIDRLVRLGLTTYEAKAYASLVRRDSYTAAQVARQAGLPRQRIYDVLASLVEKGLASTRPGGVVKYAAIAPEAAVDRLVDARRREMADLERDAVEVIAGLAPQYEAGQTHSDPLEYIEVLRDRGAINERFAELQAGVKREILVFTKPPYATPPQENVEGIEVTRTHEARAVYELSILDDPATREGVRRFIDAGEDARFVPEVPLKLVIIDEAIVMFGMQDPVGGQEELTIMVVEHHALAQTLKLAFDAVWSAGLTFEQAYDVRVKQASKPA
ncbi:MAG TPA: helix-turn-helix domain-containing protein [Candidatus Limnocylindrales bacterium]|nr:helix-turn-helix domain-containing protein [Candidatus Limnocylindrales bacterium]